MGGDQRPDAIKIRIEKTAVFDEHKAIAKAAVFYWHDHSIGNVRSKVQQGIYR